VLGKQNAMRDSIAYENNCYIFLAISFLHCFVTLLFLFHSVSYYFIIFFINFLLYKNNCVYLNLNM